MLQRERFIGCGDVAIPGRLEPGTFFPGPIDDVRVCNRAVRL